MGLRLPTGIDNEILLATLYNEQGTLSISDPFQFPARVSMWARANRFNFEKLVAAYAAEYAIADNYDRIEETTVNSDAENVYKETSADSVEQCETGRNDGRGKSVTVSHVHGNIGVTSGTQLVKEAAEHFSGLNLYQVIARMFVRDNCVLIHKGGMF